MDESRKKNDVAILLRASWQEAIAELRRFQQLEPASDTPVRAIRVPGGLVALLVETSGAASLRRHLSHSPAYRGWCWWERPDRAPVVGNARAKIRAFYASRSDAPARARSRANGAGSALEVGYEAAEVSAGNGWRLLRSTPRGRGAGSPAPANRPLRTDRTALKEAS